MTSFLGIDSDVWVVILTIIIAIETLYLIIQEKRKGSSGIEPTTADLFREMLKKIPAAKASEEDFSKIAGKKADERIQNIKEEITKEMEAKFLEISKKTKRTDAQITELRTSMENLLNKAITESRHVEKDTELEAMKNRVLTKLLDLRRHGKKTMILIQLRDDLGFYSVIFSEAIMDLEIEKMIYLTDHTLTARVSLTPKGIKRAEEMESRIYET